MKYAGCKIEINGIWYEHTIYADSYKEAIERKNNLLKNNHSFGIVSKVKGRLYKITNN